MKRNPETIRNILSNLQDYVGHTSDDPEVSYHLNLLSDAGFIDGEYMFGDGECVWTQLELTWKGHEFLASIRIDSVWEEVRQTVIANDFPLKDIPLAIIKELGNKVILDKLKQ